MGFDQLGSSSVATGIVFTAEVLGAIVAVIFCYRIYGSVQRRPWYVTASVYVFWPLCFFVPLLIPNDVVSSNYRNHCLLGNATNATLGDEAAAYDCSQAPAVGISHEAMVVLWNFVYWPGFVGTWVLFPFLMDFSMSGEFTVWARSVYSIKFNLLLYVSLGLIFGIGLLVLTIVNGPDQIVGFCIAMGNAYGLICALLLLSFGLVQVPRKIWRKGSYDDSLQWFAYRAHRAQRALASYRFKLRKAVDSLQRAAQNANVTLQSPELLASHSCATCRGRCYAQPDRRTCIASIIRKAGPYYADYQLASSYSRSSAALLSSSSTAAYSSAGDITSDAKAHAELVKLHESVVSRVHCYEVERINLDRTLQKAFKLMDVKESLQRADCLAGKYIAWTCGGARPDTCLQRCRTVVEFYWYRYAASTVWRLVGVFLALLSLVVVWCETTVFAEQPVLSVLWYLIKSIQVPMGQEVVIFLLLFYLASCVFYGLFRVRIFNYYRMHKCQMTDSRALLFCTAWLCRLLAPIAYNFLLMTHLKDGTAFAQVMHSMDVVPFIGDSFNVYLPCALAPLCLLTLVNAFGRLAQLCGIKVYRFEDPTNHADEIHAGMLFLREERQRQQRGEQRTGNIYRGIFSAHLSNANLAASLNTPSQTTVSSSTSSSSSSSSLSSMRPTSPFRLDDDDEAGIDDDEFDMDNEQPRSWFTDASSKIASWWTAGPATADERASLVSSAARPPSSRHNLAQAWQASSSHSSRFEEDGM